MTSTSSANGKASAEVLIQLRGGLLYPKVMHVVFVNKNGAAKFIEA